MPYKDPEKRKQVMRESNLRYVAKNAGKVKLMRANYHQKHLKQRRASITENNQKLGLSKTPRPKGPRSREELIVPLSRKWFLFTDQDGLSRVYFTFKKGFTAEELLDILKHLTPAKVKSHTTLTKDIKVISAPHENTTPQPARSVARQRAVKSDQSVKAVKHGSKAKPGAARAGRSRQS